MKLTHSMGDLNQQTQIASCCTEGMIYIPSETTATGTRGWRVRGVEVKTVTSSDKTASAHRDMSRQNSLSAPRQHKIDL